MQIFQEAGKKYPVESGNKSQTFTDKLCLKFLFCPTILGKLAKVSTVLIYTKNSIMCVYKFCNSKSKYYIKCIPALLSSPAKYFMLKNCKNCHIFFLNQDGGQN